ncbi:amyloid beta A4 precursor protein-binding family B member 1-interacting protein [Anopheles coustani]|uniref:amyloid beta A4 precursor protein-binding family B member 1-interacting protein n=1 Tax=Anopheles coustani TaxID=139045 RepID=UPI002658FE63|nr:amyloid beta A4 precursor protein-binding family B member 1-interacting protein [Anopheles coustani]
MKLNEKNLCMFATTPPVDLEGWLNKRGELNRSWQRRWFVLKGNLLFYFEKRGDKEPLGMIILEGCTVELAEDSEQYCFQIIFHGPHNRTYFLSTESQSNMEQWMKALTCAGYDYMKMMVAELQRQLYEIEGQCKEKTPESTPQHVPPKAPPRRQNPFNKPLSTEYASNADVSSSSGSPNSNANEHKLSHTDNGNTTTPIPLRRKAPAPPAVSQPAKAVLSSTVSSTNPSLAGAATRTAPSESIPAAGANSLEEATRKLIEDEMDGANQGEGVVKSRRQVVKATKSSDAIATMAIDRNDGSAATAASRSVDQVDGIGEQHRPIDRGAVASFSFETMHSALGIPVLADLSKWNAGQLSQPPSEAASVELTTETL